MKIFIKLTVCNFFEMVNAVILAGGRRGEYMEKDNWIYRKLFGRIIPGEEKSVRIYKGKPLVSHVINALKNSKTIDDIVVVGNTFLLKEAGINDVKCLEQGNTMIENVMIGYNYFKGQGYREKILLAPCDIPEIGGDSIDEFVEKAREGDFCLAVGDKKFLGEYDGIFHRFYFWILKDGERKKYRISNLSIVKPDAIWNKEMVEYAFSLRKIMWPGNWPNIAKELGWKSFFDYLRLKLTFEYLEERFSDKFGCDFRIIEICDPAVSFDLDHNRDSRKLRKWHKLKKVKA